ncbi:MAG: hypothetical protein AABX52_03280 [Nanoarchaeota archaeon]
MQKQYILIVFLVLLVSCIGGGRKETKTFAEFRTGSEGVRMEFLSNLPPPRQYDDQDFNIQLKVTNAGAYDVGLATDRVYISGFDPSIITGISTFGEPIPQLQGKTQFNLQGQYGFVNFKGMPRSLRSKNIDKFPFPIIATACYNYHSTAQGNVCIDPDPFSATLKQKACTPISVSMGGTQGGPIAVQGATVESSPGRIRFRIDIANVGNGLVYKFGPEFSQKCSPYDQRGLSFNEVDAVRLDRVEVSGTNILPSCKPLDQGYVRLFNNRASIECEFILPRAVAAYVSPLLVDLSYGYQQSIQRQVEIVASQ